MKDLVDDLPSSISLQQAEMIRKESSWHRAGQRDICAIRSALLHADNALQPSIKILALRRRAPFHQLAPTFQRKSRYLVIRKRVQVTDVMKTLSKLFGVAFVQAVKIRLYGQENIWNVGYRHDVSFAVIRRKAVWKEQDRAIQIAFIASVLLLLLQHGASAAGERHEGAVCWTLLRASTS